MASPPEPGRLRHIGRVVDPSVREDGEAEPELTLEGEPESVPERDEAPSASSDPAIGEAVPRGARMRERLLIKAQQSAGRETEEAPVRGDLDEIGKPVTEEPELLVAEGPRAPGTPALRNDRARLSPLLVASFGTLMGMAVVASLTAVTLHVLRREHAPLVASLPAKTTASPSAKAAEPPPASLVKKPPRTKQPGPWRIKDAAADPGTRMVEGKIGTEAFVKAVQAAGVQKVDAYRLLTAFKDIRNFDKCNKQDRFAALLERGSSRIKAFEYVVGPEEVYQAREGADGLLKGQRLDLKLERNKVTGSLLHDGTSFDASAERAGFDPGLARVVGKALEGHFALEELERGDVVRVVAQEVVVLGEFARYSGVEAIEVRRPKKEPVRVYYFDAAGERGYYDAQGRAPYEGGWRKPIPDAPMTSPFNLKRMHPVLKKTMPHLGIDFGAPTGTPIGASSFGTISFIGYSGPAGNLVKVEHPGGIVTGYAHMSRFEPALKVGDKVKRLQVVGYVGSTGRSTGPHLHFTAQRNGEFFDPATLNLDGMRTVSKDQRAAFEAVVAKYNAELDGITLPPALPEPEPAATAPAAAPGSAAPASAPAARDPGLEEGDDEEEIVAPAPALAAPPPAQAAKPTGAPVPAAPAGKSRIYLTDKELLEMQRASDDGEVPY